MLRILALAALPLALAGGAEPDPVSEPDLLEGYDPAGDVKVVVRAGEDLDLRSELVPGKVTLVEYFATWSLACRPVMRRLARLLEEEPGIAVRRVNVVDWSTPIARRYFQHGVVLPFLQVYDARGRLVAELSGPATREVERITRRVLAAVAQDGSESSRR